MAKYSTKFKIKVVNAYLNNEGRYRSLAKKYGISNEIIVRRWVNTFRSRIGISIKTIY